MGNVNELGLLAETEDNRATTLELLHIQADVWPDGSTATLSLHTKAGQTDIAVPIGQMTAAIDEMREAGNLMLERQLRALDKGRSAFVKLMASAPRPVAVEPVIDLTTGDFVFVYRFADRLPLSVRVSMEQILHMRVVCQAEINRRTH